MKINGINVITRAEGESMEEFFQRALREMRQNFLDHQESDAMSAAQTSQGELAAKLRAAQEYAQRGMPTSPSLGIGGLVTEDQNKKYRILRVLEYTGSMSWLTSTMAKNAVQGTRDFGSEGEIREAILGGSAQPLARKVDCTYLKQLLAYLGRKLEQTELDNNTSEFLKIQFRLIKREVDKLEAL